MIPTIIINYERIIEIDNELNISLYEENINFSNLISPLKPIALYYPEYNYINEKLSIKLVEYKAKLLNQINLAKNHGIYGFAIKYKYILNKANGYDETILIFLKLNMMHFLLNWENDNIKILINEYKKKYNYIRIFAILLESFVKRIKTYIISDLYIKIKQKPILSIENPLIFKNPQRALLLLRKKFKENGINEIFIICPLIKVFKNSNYTKAFDAIIDSPIFDYSAKDLNHTLINYYSGLIYKNIFLNKKYKEKLIFRSSQLNIKFNESFDNYFKDYTPEKFYILNNIIINLIIKNYKETQGIFFLKSWNDLEKGNYLEPDNNFGYASINSFSKALFNLSFDHHKYVFNYLNNRCIIAIQAHIFYNELLFEIINKTNNIPINFDLYITTLLDSNIEIFEKYLRTYSKAVYYEILQVENKGRDILPFIMQMKNHFKKYKYLCHIHTKKANHILISGEGWRNYLFENLLGDTERISRILFDLENYKKLGFIFPEPYYNVIKYIKDFDSINFQYHRPNIKYMNFVMNNLFPQKKIGKKLLFPVGDMFWAKIKSIHQIFKIELKHLFPKELGQINGTIMHAIERIWLYLVKKNGYYYKVIFNHY